MMYVKMAFIIMHALRNDIGLVGSWSVVAFLAAASPKLLLGTSAWPGIHCILMVSLWSLIRYTICLRVVVFQGHADR